MAANRDVRVHLAPELTRDSDWPGSLAVVIDVLRASTTIVHALAAGCVAVRPCAEVEEAQTLVGHAGKSLLAGERGGKPIPGFNLGNSPQEFTAARCKNTTLIFTTTNGTRAFLKAAAADRVLVGAFVNFSAVCEQILHDPRPLHIVCAGRDGQPALEDTLLAGALVDFLCDTTEVALNDSARLAWDSFENHGRFLREALELCEAGQYLKRLGYRDDVMAAAQVDKFALVPELRRDPLRIELGSVGIVKSHWPK
ncbi:MAG: 2-phosphosulfolactate phosphatase [Gemmataceae bacterium]|nr:2-phosphosulfolactate phosphatase [Gemmataceae bacterium]MCI0738998.1 2-phosphosulfolactate phosphatase [Gemmataceae bacterium]